MLRKLFGKLVRQVGEITFAEPGNEEISCNDIIDITICIAQRTVERQTIQLSGLAADQRDGLFKGIHGLDISATRACILCRSSPICVSYGAFPGSTIKTFMFVLSSVIADIGNFQPVRPTRAFELGFDDTIPRAHCFGPLRIADIDTDMPVVPDGKTGVSGMVSMGPETVAEWYISFAVISGIPFVL